MSNNRKLYCFPLYLEKVENERKRLKTITMVIYRGVAEFWSSGSFWLPNIVSKIWRWEYFLNILTSKMSIFINFDLDLHFQGQE